MKKWMSLAAVAGLVCAAVVAAEDKTIEPIKTWKGSIDDERLLGKPPTVIAGKDEWQKLWKSWKLEGVAPEVDFEKELVVVQTTVGSKLNLILKLKEGGDLQVLGFGTRDFGPGFRYVMATISRAGIISANGHAIAADK